jgi:hypothetical protein
MLPPWAVQYRTVMFTHRHDTCYRRLPSDGERSGSKDGGCPVGPRGTSGVRVVLRRGHGTGGRVRLRRRPLRGHARAAAVLADASPAAATRDGADDAEPRLGAPPGTTPEPHGERYHHRRWYGCRHRASPDGRLRDADNPGQSGRRMDGRGHSAKIHRAATRRPQRDAATACRGALRRWRSEALQGRGRRVRGGGLDSRGGGHTAEAAGYRPPHVFRDR